MSHMNYKSMELLGTYQAVEEGKYNANINSLSREIKTTSIIWLTHIKYLLKSSKYIQWENADFVHKYGYVTSVH